MRVTLVGRGSRRAVAVQIQAPSAQAKPIGRPQDGIFSQAGGSPYYAKPGNAEISSAWRSEPLPFCLDEAHWPSEGPLGRGPARQTWRSAKQQARMPALRRDGGGRFMGPDTA